jgi:hypothetical protein
MKENFDQGIYEDLITQGLRVEIEKISSEFVVEEKTIDVAELPLQLNRHLSKVLLRALQSFSEQEIENLGPELVNELISKTRDFTNSDDYLSDQVSAQPKALVQVSEKLPNGEAQQIRIRKWLKSRQVMKCQR